ncbi:unnamed protein product [Gordionus sp. m RMFG-2023]
MKISANDCHPTSIINSIIDDMTDSKKTGALNEEPPTTVSKGEEIQSEKFANNHVYKKPKLSRFKYLVALNCHVFGKKDDELGNDQSNISYLECCILEASTEKMIDYSKFYCDLNPFDSKSDNQDLTKDTIQPDVCENTNNENPSIATAFLKMIKEMDDHLKAKLGQMTIEHDISSGDANIRDLGNSSSLDPLVKIDVLKGHNEGEMNDPSQVNFDREIFCFVTEGPCTLRQCIHQEFGRILLARNDSNPNQNSKEPVKGTESIETTFDEVEHKEQLLLTSLPPYFYRYLDVLKIEKTRTWQNYPEEERSNEGAINKELDSDVVSQPMKRLVGKIISLLDKGYNFDNPEVISAFYEPGLSLIEDIYLSRDTVIRARGLPWHSMDQDIANFFKGLNISKAGIALCLSPMGRRNGEAFIKFQDPENRDLALKRHKHHMGSRYIEVYKANIDDFLRVSAGANNEVKTFLSTGAEIIIRMRGLPYDANNQTIINFFEDESTIPPNDAIINEGADEHPKNDHDSRDIVINEPISMHTSSEEEKSLVPSGIYFVKKFDGRATGDAFVLFNTEIQGKLAMNKHRKCIGNRYIELFRSTVSEVQQVSSRQFEQRLSQQIQSPRNVNSGPVTINNYQNNSKNIAYPHMIHAANNSLKHYAINGYNTGPNPINLNEGRQLSGLVFHNPPPHLMRQHLIHKYNLDMMPNKMIPTMVVPVIANGSAIPNRVMETVGSNTTFPLTCINSPTLPSLGTDSRAQRQYIGFGDGSEMNKDTTQSMNILPDLANNSNLIPNHANIQQPFLLQGLSNFGNIPFGYNNGDPNISRRQDNARPSNLQLMSPMFIPVGSSDNLHIHHPAGLNPGTPLANSMSPLTPIATSITPHHVSPIYHLPLLTPPSPMTFPSFKYPSSPIVSIPLSSPITRGSKKDCIRLRGLPFEAKVEQILEFLGDFAKFIVFQGVHMIFNLQGQPSGEAFIQMNSEHSAKLIASTCHNKYMRFAKKQRYIEVFQCSGDEMNAILSGFSNTKSGNNNIVISEAIKPNEEYNNCITTQEANLTCNSFSNDCNVDMDLLNPTDSSNIQTSLVSGDDASSGGNMLTFILNNESSQDLNSNGFGGLNGGTITINGAVYTPINILNYPGNPMLLPCYYPYPSPPDSPDSQKLEESFIPHENNKDVPKNNIYEPFEDISSPKYLNDNVDFMPGFKSPNLVYLTNHETTNYQNFKGIGYKEPTQGINRGSEVEYFKQFPKPEDSLLIPFDIKPRYIHPQTEHNNANKVPPFFHLDNDSKFKVQSNDRLIFIKSENGDLPRQELLVTMN